MGKKKPKRLLSELTEAELDAHLQELQGKRTAIEQDPANANKTPGSLFRFSKEATKKLDVVARAINDVAIERRKRNGSYNHEAATAGYSGRQTNKR